MFRNNRNNLCVAVKELVCIVALAFKLMIAIPALAAGYIERDDDTVGRRSLRGLRLSLLPPRCPWARDQQ